MEGVHDELITRINRRPGHSFEATWNGLEAKGRVFHAVAHMGPPHDLGVFNSGVDAVGRALLERYFFCKVGDQFEDPLEVVDGAFDQLNLDIFREMTVRSYVDDVEVLAMHDVVKLYNGPKRKLYADALESLRREKLSKWDADLRPFTKFEKQDLGKAPRIIQPRSPRYNLKLGKFLKKLEKGVYHALNETWGARTSATVIKGFNIYESAKILRAKWDLFRNPVAVSIDAAKFDAHVSVKALLYEHSFYQMLFAGAAPKQRQLLDRLLRWQRVQKGVAHCQDGRVKFSVRGTRSSGDLNTSLGNCILMCAMVWAYIRDAGLFKVELANNGDDCVVIMEREDLDIFLGGLETWFRDHGFRMGVDGVATEFERVLFCQSQPVWDGNDWRMVRHPLQCLKKDPMCLVPIVNDRGMRKWRYAVSVCGKALVSGLPMMGAFYDCLGRGGIRCGARFIRYVFNHTSMMERSSGIDVNKHAPVTPQARLSFFKAFGITPDLQLAYEEYYGKLRIGRLSTDKPVADRITARSIPIISEAPEIFTINDD